MSPSGKTLYLIDGSSYIYRAFYALGRLTNSKGMATQAIYGFAQMLLKVLREHEPHGVCVVFDAPGPTFRHEMYEEYKATRQRMPEDLVQQIPYIKELVRCHGVPQLEREGVEADDVIATLADKAGEEGWSVVIVSGDKDLYQLVQDPRVRQWDPQRDKTTTEKEVLERYGVTPRQMADFLALMGDSSDNVPGVPKVGEKTAGKLLARWDSLDGMYENLEKVSGSSLRKNLEENRERAYLSRRLVTLRRDLALDVSLDDLQASPVLEEDLESLYRELDFQSLLESFREEGILSGKSREPAPQAVGRTDRTVRSSEELEEVVESLRGTESFSVDLETTSENPMRAELVGVALSWKDHEACYIPVGHTGDGSEGQLSSEEVLGALTPLLEKEAPSKVGQNVKYEWVVFRRHGVALNGIGFDTMVADYLLNPGSHSHKLERIAREHLGEGMISYEDVAGKGKNQVSFAEVAVKAATEYACEDAEIAWRLAPVLRRKLAESALEELCDSLERPLIEVLASMEHKGVLVDASKLEELARELDKRMDQRAARIYELAGEDFNIQSPKQLGGILFDKLHLKVVKKTKTGPSTDVSVLETLAAEHPIAEEILDYRSLAKLKGTYAEALPKLIHPETGRIHTSYNQTVTATGRLSSSNPNLQNIPVRTEEGRKIRQAFIPAPGCVLLSADYSQIELRILAHYSGDENLVAAFREGEDVHRRTAAEVLDVAPQEVTPEMRRQAKAINFGIIYGMGPFGLARQLRISNTSAKGAIDRYFERYRGVKRFIEETVEEAKKRGYCQTLLGRIRRTPELQSRNRTVRQQGERLAVNTTIQGTAADLIKKAMIEIHGALRAEGLRSEMTVQVHDELIFEVPEDELERMKALVQERMENVRELNVPLQVDVGWGSNWGEAH